MLKPRAEKASSVSSPLSLSACIAKTSLRSDGTSGKGIDVLSHCLIVGEVARELITRMDPWLRKALFPEGSDLLAAAHDVGKVSPTFQEKIRRNIHGYKPNSEPGLEKINPETESQWGKHSGVSYAAVKDAGEPIASILGRHHGNRVNPIYPSDYYMFGGPAWQARRQELLQALKVHFKTDWPVIKDDVQASVLAGLTSVADWIGSGSSFDLFSPESSILSVCAAQALDEAGFIHPTIRHGLSFRDIFPFDAKEAQTSLIESVITPGVYILEAPMGIGKTEAALYAAYRMLEKGRATGIYFALPTRLTSDKIHERMNVFLTAILQVDSTFHKSLLLHSSAWLMESDLGEEGEPGNSWFDERKRGLLAPFAVGTIDQALMAVMNVKHSAVRLLGLAGKIVILDEVHSYDSYTGTIIQSLIKALRSIQCTVIVLSATLTAIQRVRIMGIPAESLNDTVSYPLISAQTDTGRLNEIKAGILPDVEVKIMRTDDDSPAVEEALIRAGMGQQVLWIENTVKEAQDRYQHLSARSPEYSVDTGLLHSRYTKDDRSRNESYWVDLFGLNGKIKRSERGRILVGTQVLEQSLDIDADFLVTRICPSDMLLQRMGRLWRHTANDPLRTSLKACREAWILKCDLQALGTDYKKALGKSQYVYAPYVLARTLEVWAGHNSIRIPGDIRSLIEATYADREESDLLQQLKAEMEKERDRLQSFALMGVSIIGKTIDDKNAATRYADRETCDVLLVRSLSMQPDKNVEVTLLNGETIIAARGLRSTDRKKWRTRAAALSRSVITVSEAEAPVPIRRDDLGSLRYYLYLGEDELASLRVGIVREDGAIESLGFRPASSKYQLQYDDRLGYQAKKGKAG